MDHGMACASWGFGMSSIHTKCKQMSSLSGHGGAVPKYGGWAEYLASLADQHPMIIAYRRHNTRPNVLSQTTRSAPVHTASSRASDSTITFSCR